MKHYGLAVDQLKESKRQYNQNYAAQRTLTNSQLEDRQHARVASNAGAYESVGSYMNRDGSKYGDHLAKHRRPELQRGKYINA